MKLLANAYYFPPISYCAFWVQCTTLFIEHNENYQKKSFRNKCNILSTQGNVTLSVPLKKGKHQSTPYTKVTIAYDEPWIKHHLHTISSCYAHAPYYEHYIQNITSILSKRHHSIFDLNLDILSFLSAALDIHKPIKMTTSFQKGVSDAIKDIRDNFTAPPTPILPRYQQVYSRHIDYIPDLSILDLLFCQGPAARLYLKQISLDSIIHN